MWVLDMNISGSTKYRNPNGAYMKLMNFRRFDPEFTKEGKVGLTRGGKDEEYVWAEFAGDPTRCHEVALAIRSAIDLPDMPSALMGPEEDDMARLFRTKNHATFRHFCS